MTNLIALQNGTELVGDFRIERMLGAGGFGITYLADEVALDRRVTIKEYFPSDFAIRAQGDEAVPRSENCSGDYRWGLDRFIEEAQTLAKFNHPNIVRVYRYFRANSTGYMVLHFEEGQSLKAWLKGLGRAPRQKELDGVVAPLLEALELIHKSDFLHRDIAPDNIIIRKDGQPVLIDFGSARGEIAAHAKSKTVSALVKPGYSPYEQYAETSRQQGPWTDIYALAATLYHAVTGRRPADSPSRMVSDEMVPAREAAVGAYRPQFLAAIDHGLTLAIEGRPQSVAAWRKDLLVAEPEKPKRRTLALLRSGRGAEKEELVSPAAVAAAAGAQTREIPPPPDAPGAHGSMADFFEGLRKKRQGAAAAPRVAPAPAEPAAVAPAADPTPAPAPSASAPPVRAQESADTPPRIFVRAGGETQKERRLPARPRPIRTGTSSWRPLLFKLLVGVGVASGAVALQDKFPRVESRGASVTSGDSRVATGSIAVPDRPAIVALREIKGHVGAASAVQYAADGKTLVSTGDDATLKIWSAASGTLVRTIELDNGRATALAVNGARALTGHATGEIVLWDLARADKLATFKRNDAEIWSVAFVGRADRFAASSHDWKVTLWDAANTAGPVQIFDGHESAVQAIAYSNSERGPLLASGGADRIINVWNLDTLDRVQKFRGHKDFVTAIAFSQNGKLLASGGLDGNIRIWSPASGRALRRLYGHRSRVRALAFAPTGSTLVSAGDDGQLRVWNVERGRTARTIVGHAGGIRSVAVSPDGGRFATAGEDGMIRLWSNPVEETATN